MGNAERESRRGGGAVGRAAALAILLAAGCTSPARPIFPEPRPARVWPPAPLPARIRYVGEIASSDDVDRGPGFLESIGRFFAGRGGPERLYGPRSVWRTPDGRRVWIADLGGRCLHLFDLEGRSYRKVEGVGGDPLLGPVDLCGGPAGSFFVCDAEGAAIHRLAEKDGARIETLRIPDEIQRPVAITFRETTGDLFVVDVAAHDVKVLGPEGRLRRILGERGTAPGQFNFPTDIADDGEGLWVVDSGNHRVQGLTYAGEPRVVFGHAGDAPGDLALPKGIAVDGEGHLYVVDARFENVQIFDRTGRLLLFFGEEGTGPGEFWLPSGIHIDGNDWIWICDSYNGRVQVFAYVSQGPEGGGRTP